MSAQSHPQLGDIVLYVEGNPADTDELPGELWPGTNGQRTHPAMVTRVVDADTVNLHVFLDGTPAVFPDHVVELPKLTDQKVRGVTVDTSVTGWFWPPK